jgi:hypothetical protein
MEPNDYVVNVGDIDVSSYTLSNDTITISASGSYVGASGSYDCNIDWVKIDILKSNRSDIKDEGKIPIDIWARMYNNGKIDD